MRPHFLIIRTTSLADVALALRIVYPVVRLHPEYRFTFLMKPSLTGVLVNAPANLEAMVIDLDRSEKRIAGMLRLVRKLRNERFTGVIDLERSRRSRFISTVLCTFSKAKLSRVPRTVAVSKTEIKYIPYDEGKRYLEHFTDCFRKSELIEGELPAKTSVLSPSEPQCEAIRNRIGIAPFAKNGTPEESLEVANQIATALKNSFGIDSLVIGADENVTQKFITKENEGNIFPYSSFYKEIGMLSSLRIVLGVDTSRLQLARLVGVPVLFLKELPHTKEQITQYVLTPLQGLLAQQTNQ